MFQKYIMCIHVFWLQCFVCLIHPVISEPSDALVEVASLLEEVKVGLVAYYKFVAAVDSTHSLGIHLVIVAKADAVEDTSYEECH